jgi:DNA-binding NarL/FixJ family response regulator
MESARKTPDGTTRVLLVDDHKLVREGLRQLLASRAGIEVVGEAGDGEEAVELALVLRPDVVVMDVFMPRMNGVEATRRIVEQIPGIRVIGLSMHQGDEMAESMKRAGAADYLSKDGPTEALVTTIRGGEERPREPAAPPSAFGLQPPAGG